MGDSKQIAAYRKNKEMRGGKVVMEIQGKRIIEREKWKTRVRKRMKEKDR
jgi:hypothetical protein